MTLPLLSTSISVIAPPPVETEPAIGIVASPFVATNCCASFGEVSVADGGVVVETRQQVLTIRPFTYGILTV